MKNNIATLNDATQNGAQIFISLLGKPEDVQKDAYFLYNNGIAVLPEDYRDGQDDTVTLSTNLYRLAKYARACALASIACGGRKQIKRMKLAIDLKTNKYAAQIKEMLKPRHLPLKSSPAREYASGGKGGGDMEHGAMVSRAMQSVAEYAERVEKVNEFSKSK